MDIWLVFLGLTTLVCWLVSVWLYHWAKAKNDCFASALPALLACAVSIILSAAYAGNILWTHRFY